MCFVYIHAYRNKIFFFVKVINYILSHEKCLNFTQLKASNPLHLKSQLLVLLIQINYFLSHKKPINDFCTYTVV